LITDQQIIDRHKEIRNFLVGHRLKLYPNNPFLTNIDVEAVYDELLVKIFTGNSKPTFENVHFLDAYIKKVFKNRLRVRYFVNKNERTPKISHSTLMKNYELARQIINEARK
jgi:hypothetical protein